MVTHTADDPFEFLGFALSLTFVVWQSERFSSGESWAVDALEGKRVDVLEWDGHVFDVDAGVVRGGRCVYASWHGCWLVRWWRCCWF